MMLSRGRNAAVMEPSPEKAMICTSAKELMYTSLAKSMFARTFFVLVNLLVASPAERGDMEEQVHAIFCMGTKEGWYCKMYVLVEKKTIGRLSTYRGGNLRQFEVSKMAG